jgi:GT2 family glycosyltransferase/glycosyltransferase involved in cell wall biosynthesis
MDTADYPDWELVIVDHGSTDGTLRWVRKQKYARLLIEPRRGVATALNTAFRSTDGRDVVRIHSDVIAETPGWLSMMVDAAYDLPRAGIVGAKLVYADDRIQAVGRNIVTGLGIKDRHADVKAFQADSASLNKPEEVDCVPGAFAYYRRAVINATGGLDEGYWPKYLEDDDFCVMARLRGYKVYAHAGVKGIHFTPAPLSPTNYVALKDTEGLLSNVPVSILKQFIVDFHATHWQAKWGWHPQYPDLGEIRRLYGHTEICWRIGEPMRYRPVNWPPSVDVVAVTWNNKDLLHRCMESLAKTDYPNVKVHISDNGSTDGTLEYLKELGKDFPYPLFVYPLAVNTGVTVGLNWAIVHGDSELVARIDDDIVLSPDWLKVMVEDFRLRPFAGVIGPKIINDTVNRDIQSGPYRHYPGIYGHDGEPDAGQANYLSRASHVRGCCNLYRRDALLNSGLFDLRFSPTQYDDPDHHIALLCKGYEVIYDGRVNVIHKLSSGAADSYASISNKRCNSEKLFGKWGADVWMIIDRAIEQSVEGRYIPLDADLSEFYGQLPPPESYPRDHQVVLDQNVSENLLQMSDFMQLVLEPDGPLNSFWNDHIAHAAHMRRDGNPTLAAVVLRGILDYAPRKAELLYELAITLELTGEIKRAALLVKRAMLLEPENQDFRALLTRLDNQSGKIAYLPHIGKSQVPGDKSREIGEIAPVSGPCISGAAKLRVLMTNTFQQRAPGGDMMQLKKTKQYLEKKGVHVDVSYAPCPNPKGYDLVHAFNLWFPHQTLPQLKFIRMAAPKCPIVMTPIYWDMREKAWADHAVPEAFANAGTEGDLLNALSYVTGQSLHFNERPASERPEPNFPGYEEYQRQILSMVDHMFPQSEREMRVMHEILGTKPPYTVTFNAAETAVFDKAKPDWFVETYGIRDFVITVGLVEPRKNQLMLLYALRDTGIPVVVLGRNYDRNYFRLCRKYAAPSTIFIDHLPHERLASALKAARVFALPSWMECASFANIEAALAGCSLAVSDRTSEPEYFGDCAYYCDPADVNSIRNAVLRAMNKYKADALKREWLRELFTKKYTWDFVAEKVLEGYGLAMEKRSSVNEPVMVCSSKSSQIAY